MDILPYLYAVPKMHKLKFRFIAGVGKKSLLPIQQQQQQGDDDQTEEEQQPEDGDGSMGEDGETTDEEEDYENLEEFVQQQIQQVRARHDEPIHKPKCSTTALSKDLSKQLSMVIDLLKMKDENSNNEYSRCFILRKGEEVFNLINEHSTD